MVIYWIMDVYLAFGWLLIMDINVTNHDDSSNHGDYPTLRELPLSASRGEATAPAELLEAVPAVPSGGLILGPWLVAVPTVPTSSWCISLHNGQESMLSAIFGSRCV